MKNFRPFIFIILLLLAIYSCKKATNTSSPKSYTSKMAGLRAWNGVEEDVNHFSGLVTKDTIYSISFDITISVLDDTTIVTSVPQPIPDSRYLPQKLHYSNSVHSDSTITFVSDGITEDTIVYNYKSNVLTEHQFQKSSTFWWDVSLHTP